MTMLRLIGFAGQANDRGPVFVTLRRDFDAASRGQMSEGGRQMNNSFPPGQYGVKEDVV